MHPESEQDGCSLVYAEHTCAKPGKTHRTTRVLCGLAIAVVIIAVLGGVAFLVYQGIGPACQVMSDCKKVNIACPLKGPNSKEEYEIFTANKTATYLIYGVVRCREDHRDFIYLKQRWKESDPLPIHSKEHRYSDACIFAEVKVRQDSKVYLSFNMGRPTCSGTVFRVYEL